VKRTFIFIVFVIVIGLPVIGNTDTEVLKGSSGNLILKKEYKSTGITVSDEAQNYDWRRAIWSPGEVISGKTSEKREITGLFSQKNTRTIEIGVVLENNKVKVVKDKTATRNLFNPYFIFWLIAILGMLFAKIYFKIFGQKWPVVLGVLIAFFAAFGVAVSLFFLLPFLFLVVIMFFTALTGILNFVYFFMFPGIETQRETWSLVIFNVLFYIVMVLALFFVLS